MRRSKSSPNEEFPWSADPEEGSFYEGFLAPYAVKSVDSKGRIHPEVKHPYRSVFQRDRDRIIHSTAFRRLEYKTQVFVYHEGDYYRTRLTHTIEVAQISSCVARALRLNEDLCEAIALSHDLGHTPFGHAGEEALNSLMKEEGGFEHNRHGLRVVDKLEKRYPGFDGLNLSWEVREGIIKHTTNYDHPVYSDFEPEKKPSLEAQVVNLADEIAYDSHDLDDGLTAGPISEKALEDVPIWKDIRDSVVKAYPMLEAERRKYQIIRMLINELVTDLLGETLMRLKELKISSVDEARDAKCSLVSFSEGIKKNRETLKKFLLDNLYSHYRVIRMTQKAERFIRELFGAYLDRPEQLPPGRQSRLSEDSLKRVVCDYIAGMTDRYALDEYKKLFMPYEKV